MHVPSPQAPRGARDAGDVRTVALRTKLGSRRGRTFAAGAVLLALTGSTFATLGSGETATAAPTTYSIWPSTTVPKNPAEADSASVEVGTRFSTSSPGWATAVRYYKSAKNTGTHVGTLWDSSGRALAKVTFAGESTSGWQQASFSTPVSLKPGVNYVVSYRAPNGQYANDTDALSPTKPAVNYALKATQGLYTYGTGAPNQTWRNSNYYVDLVFTTNSPTSPSPTTTSSSTPTTATTTAAPTPTTTTSTTAAPSPTTSTSTTAAPPALTTTTTTAAPNPTSTTSAPTSTPSSTGGTAAPATTKPGAGNTGVPVGTQLTAVSGGLTLRTAGQVVDAKDISGPVVVDAPNVVIKRSRIQGTSATSYGVYVRSGSVRIEDSEISGFQNGIAFDNWTALRVNIHSVSDDGVKLGSNVRLEASWIHNMTPSAGAHADGGQLQSGVTNLAVINNNIDVSGADSNAALFLAPDLGPSTDGPVNISGNWLNGGNFTLYCVDGNNGQYFVKNISITNNRFGRSSNYGPSRVNVPITQNGNVWDDTGAGLKL